MSTIRVAIIDDKAGNRNILKHKLMQQELFEVCLSAEDGKDFIEQMKALPEKAYPHVALMDLEMPNMNGVDAIALGSSLFPLVKFVVLTIFDDEDMIFKAIKAGAFGYLLKDESAENIADMLLQMQESGAGPISPEIAHKILKIVQNNELTLTSKENKSPSDFFDLSAREKQILDLLVKGLFYKEIADKLDISINTAKKHIISIYNKLHVNSRAQALHLAYERGLL